MKLRKILALVMALTMVMGIAMTAAAEEWSVVCTTLGAASSEALTVTTTPQTWTFTSTTNADAFSNWEAAAVNVTSANGWELTIRSDCYAVSNANGWGSAGEDAVGGKSYPADWAVWQEANRAGVPCKVTAQVVAGSETNYIIVGFSNNGVANVYMVPTTAAVDSVTLTLTGENCVLTGLSTSEDHLDLSAAIGSIPSDSETVEWSVVCTTLGAATSEALPVTTTPKTWIFTSTTNADALNNWDAAAVDVTSANGWELTIRSDCYAVSNTNGWGTAGENAVGGKTYPADWTAWLEANKGGVSCKVTAQVVAGSETNYIIVGFSNNGVTNVYMLPTTAAVDSVNLALTGENCVLTGLSASEDHIDLSTAIDSIPADGETVEWSVVCTTLGAASSEALPVTTTPKTWTFTSTTNADALNNWDTAAVNVFSSEWELTARSDSFAVSKANGWGTDGEAAFGGKSYPDDWAAWLEANKGGVSCKVTAQVVDGKTADYVVVGFTNNNVTNIYVVPVASVDSVNVHLTGENCVLTELAASEEHIDISAAVASVTDKPVTPSDPSNPQTGDNLAAVVMAMLVSAVGLTVVAGSKRKFF